MSSPQEFDMDKLRTTMLSPPGGSTGPRSPERRSPSCGRGRTMKDFEEELIELRRENFDLKMRIYIMEEQQDMLPAFEGPENVAKINSDLKNELAMLRKDFAEKEELILQAAKAMELIDTKHKTDLAEQQLKFDREREHYQADIQRLEEELRILSDKGLAGPDPKFENSSAMYAVAFGLKSKNTNQEVNGRDMELEVQLASLDRELQDEITRRSECEAIITRLQSDLASLQEVHNATQEELAAHMDKLRVAQAELENKNTMLKNLESNVGSLEMNMREKGNGTMVPVLTDLQKKLNEQEQLYTTNRHNQLQIYQQENLQLKEQVRQLTSLLEKREISHQWDGQKSDVEKQLEASQDEVRKKDIEIERLKSEHSKACKAIQGFVLQNKGLARELEILKSNMDNCKSNDQVSNGAEHLAETNKTSNNSEQYKANVEELSEKLSEVTKERDAVSLEMEKQVQALLHCLQDKENMLKEFEEKFNLFDNVVVKDKQIVELQNEIDSLKEQLEGKIESLVTPRVEKLTASLNEELELRKKEIEHLNEELRKRTINLQELVNTELWDKNREIEKLNKTCERKQLEVCSLKEQLHEQDNELKKLEKKITELDIGIKRNSSQHANENSCNNVDQKESLELERLRKKIKEDGDLIQSLEEECASCKEELDQSEKSRKELINACTLLTTRLEELATFLDSLLPVLGEKKRRMLQEAIERSREVSRSFSTSFIEQANGTVSILPDCSQIEFCSGDDSVEVESGKTNLDKSENEVVMLRSQVDLLVKKLKQKENCCDRATRSSPKRLSIWSNPPKVEKNNSYDFLKMTSLHEDGAGEGNMANRESDSPDLEFDSKWNNRLENLAFSLKEEQSICKENEVNGVGDASDSEGWSEPDRSVSKARIGIKESPKLKCSSEDSSSSLCKPLSAPPSGKKLRESFDIRRLRLKLKNLEQTNNLLRLENRSLRNPTQSKIDKDITCKMTGEMTMSDLIIKKVRFHQELLETCIGQNNSIFKILEEALIERTGKEAESKKIMEGIAQLATHLEESCKLCLELEGRCSNQDVELASFGERLQKAEARNSELEVRLKEAEEEASTRRNEALECQCSMLEMHNAALEAQGRACQAEGTARAFQAALEQAKSKWQLLESTALASETALNESRKKCSALEAQVEDLKNSLESEKQKLTDKYNLEASSLRTRLSHLKVELDKLAKDHKKELTSACKKIQEVVLLKDIAEGEWKVKMELLEKDKKKEIEEEITKRMEAERKLIQSYEIQAELRAKLETEMDRLREIEASRKVEEKLWIRRIASAEKAKVERELDFHRKMDTIVSTAAEALIDNSRLANEKLRLQGELRHTEDIANKAKWELEQRVAELELANKELERIADLKANKKDAETQPDLQKDSESESLSPRTIRMPGNTHFWFPVCGRSNNNSSPDLGIESDQGRLSSLEPITNSNGDSLEAENSELRRQLGRTRRALEETLAQLTTANQKKKQVEKAICKQLHKTHHILQKARVNLETDSSPQ